ncbi:hypothetical protein J437_LFUL000372, partial [Ladona fulva]
MMLHLNMKQMYQLLFFISILEAVLCSTDVGESISQHLIRKYSNSSEFLTKDDLQRLLDKLKTCCSTNSTKLDPNIVTPECKQSQNCSQSQQSFFSAEYLYTYLDIEDGKFSSASLKNMCPVILGELENWECSSAFDSQDTREEKRKPTPSEVWGYGFLFVTLISLCSLLGVSVLPFMGKEFYKFLLTGLIGLAVGSLAASSVFHLIP